MDETVLCPRCKVNRYTPYGEGPLTETAPPYPALSRAADIYICSPCGTHEAFMDLASVDLTPPDEWPIGPVKS